MENKLTEDQLKQIEMEAKNRYADNGVTGNPLIYGKRIGYTAAASKYLLRVKDLEDGLREIRKEALENSITERHGFPIEIAFKAKQLLNPK